MKHLKKLILCALALCLLALPVAASAHYTALKVSTTRLNPGQTAVATLTLSPVTVSSLGVEVTLPEGMAILQGVWLQKGLMASFDPVKNKGVFSPGSAQELSGDLVEVTFAAKNPGRYTVKLKLIGKNGTETVFTETLTKTVTVLCPSHSWSAWEQASENHSRLCSLCGEAEQQSHRFGDESLTPASCQAEGKAVSTCADCGAERTQVLPKTEHAPSGWLCHSPAQPGIPGESHTECTLCGAWLDTRQEAALPQVTEPEPTEPAPTEPEPTEPEPTEPAEPAPTEPTPGEPAPTQPESIPTQPESILTQPETAPESTPEPAPEVIPEETVPEETVPEEAIPEETVPEVLPEVPTPEAPTPEAPAPEVPTPEAPAPADPAPAPEAPAPERNPSRRAFWALLVIPAAAILLFFGKLGKKRAKK